MSVTKMVNPVKEALEQAKNEVKEEEQKKMVAQFKRKLLEVENAKAIVRNLERELADLEYELGEL